MIYAFRQGWKLIWSALLALLLLVFFACDDKETRTYEGPFEVENMSDLEEVIDQEEQDFPYEDENESGPSTTTTEESYVYDANAELVEFYPSQEGPKLATMPPVGDVISDEKWDSITEGISFERTKQQTPENLPELRGVDFGEGFLSGLSTLAWIFVVALILGILVWLIARTKVDTSVDKVRDFTLTDELFAASKEELAGGLTQNLSRKDYREAIRYRFGQLLQTMRKEGLLIWVPGRTNAEYQKTLKAPFFEPFGVLAKAFSYALYSGKEISSTHYDAFAVEADAFLALMSSLSLKPNSK